VRKLHSKLKATASPLRLIATVSLLLLLAACGQKGPLKLPEQAQNPADQPSSEPQQNSRQ